MRYAIALAAISTCVIAASSQQQTPPPAQGQQPPGRAGAPGGPPQGPKNLQVLPKDWTNQQVQAYMRTFTSGLGVQCNYCHSGTPADRALDDKKEKLVARKMIAMMMAINDQYLKDVGDPPAAAAAAAPGAPPQVPAQKVTCYTCHRGTTKPLTAAPPGGGGH